MKFGNIDQPELVDFILPSDHPDTKRVLETGKGLQGVFVGCAKWNRQDLKNFYPRGTKDELVYYATQFNAIELNATFYSHFSKEQIQRWVNKTPPHFMFFPKVHRRITHLKRLHDVEESIDLYVSNIRIFGTKLGRCFLQLHDNFGTSHLNFKRLVKTVEYWPKDVPLAIELRNTQWFHDVQVANDLTALLRQHNIATVITDTAGRRDLLHMRLTTPDVFIRYVGANHPSDYSRLDDWTLRLKAWGNAGMETIAFFLHQNLEKESPMLAAHLINKLNQQWKRHIPISEITSPSSII